MSFIKPELHHRRSYSSSPAANRRRSRKRSAVAAPTSSPDNSSQSIQPSPLHASHSDSALPSTVPSPVGLSRRRSHPDDDDDDNTPEKPNKRRRKEPEHWWEITRETPVLRPLPSSGELSRTQGWATSYTSSSSDEDFEEPVVMEGISMDRILVSETEKQELHKALDSAFSDEQITENQRNALKEVFDITFDQRQLYNDWLVQTIKTDDEDEGVAIQVTQEEHEEGHEPEIKKENSDDSTVSGVHQPTKSDVTKQKSRSPSPPRAVSVAKLKDALVSLRDGVGKFSLRLKEARDKQIVLETVDKPRRSKTFRSMLLQREANRCIVTRIGDSLIAAHILPFTIASISRSHRFWSMLRLMLGPDICDKLFERYGYKSSPKHRGNRGINSLENGWILRSNLDDAFTRMQCYLEPIPEEPNKYIFNWLEEPDDLPSFSRRHHDESKRQKFLETGTIIDLTPIESQGSQNSPTKDATTTTTSPPSRALITMQAAIHKLANKFRGQADVFDSFLHEDWDSESVSSIDEEEERVHEEARRQELMQPITADNHMYFCDGKIAEWLRSVSPEQPEAAGTKRKHSELEEEDETEPPTDIERDPRPNKRTKFIHNPSPVSPATGRKPKPQRARPLAIRAVAATTLQETGLLSPGITNKSETSPEERGRTRQYIARGCKRALTYEPPRAITPKGNPSATQPTPQSISRKRAHATIEEPTPQPPQVTAKPYIQDSVPSRKRKRST
ncbi:hypothetical protein H072_2375 [Dactylellina haptotyla CBS 200.50]|uniref:HNH nuclease domain-containing protein n=1 Tax=Dactylellina haptotyla (strain CBS 200.50) TaxID=1284197 RepID=S8ARF7_DACHA|nr:hypothetical protein H072_2375 [Dactylellina haptotyla CBS 200.50]